jgi:hypothetical protein
LIDVKRIREYDNTVRLLGDLRDLSLRQGRAEFDQRVLCSSVDRWCGCGAGRLPCAATILMCSECAQLPLRVCAIHWSYLEMLARRRRA